MGLERVVSPLVDLILSIRLNYLDGLATVLLFPLCDHARPWFRFSTQTSSVLGLALYLVALLTRPDICLELLHYYPRKASEILAFLLATECKQWRSLHFNLFLLEAWHHETFETMKPLTPRNLWNHETLDTTKPMTPLTPRNLWNLRNHWHHETYETYETLDTMKPMKPLTPRNLWNHETIDTTKPMKPWNHWHHETYETMKPLTPRNLWNHETIDTTKPVKPWTTKPWNLWHYIVDTKPHYETMILHYIT